MKGLSPMPWSQVFSSSIWKFGRHGTAAQLVDNQITHWTYERAIAACLRRDGLLSIAVVGANDGKFGDPLYPILTADNQIRLRTKVLLIEPQPPLIPILEQNYAFHPNAVVKNCAIGSQNKLKLYAIKEEYWPRVQPSYASGWPPYRAPTGVTSSNKQHVVSWLERHLPGVPPESCLDSFEVDTFVLPQLLETVGWPAQIDVLQIDAEGNDDAVIDACRISETQPALILYEQKHLSPEKALTVAGHLTGLGYFLVPKGKDVLAMRVGPSSISGHP
ncbi:MAG: FkbM family methyltransferase [Hyphomicrobium sp.]|jgi:FkbM family methyltransferase|nr:FkbM family methyltransferase [Hyphomicrobium sp.]